MKIKEVMTKEPVTVTLPSSRTKVIRTLVESSLTGIPILKGKDGEYVGVITRHHLFRKPEVDQLALLVDENYPTMTPDQSVNTAARIFLEKNINYTGQFLKS